MKVNRFEANRAFVLFLLVMVWVSFIAGTLIKIQIFDYNKYLDKVKAQKNRIIYLHSKRGTLYDIHGELMATSIKSKSVFLSNKDRLQSCPLLDQIATKICLSPSTRQSIKKRINKGDKFIWIKRKLSIKDYSALQSLVANENSGSLIHFIEEYKRIYPQNETAAHVLGGVGIDEQGLSGIEYEFDSVIKGKGGQAEIELDARKKVFKLNYITSPVPGQDIHLTVDSVIQYLAEKELEKAILMNQAKGGSVIILDSQSGAVLAMASYPFYKPENINMTPYETLKNKAISFLYEPGSTFKVVLASAALDSQVCYPQQLFNLNNGVMVIRDIEIRDTKPFNQLNFKDIFVYSSNIGAAKIGQRIGKARLFNIIQNFGFGQKTGITLPAEENGILHPAQTWSDVSIAFLSDGYEIAVTPLQMAMAFNVIASGGYLIKPYMVADQQYQGSQRIKILSKSTVQTLGEIMTEVVNRGTGVKAQIMGIDIAGKTGTAKKLVKGKYEQIYVSSFGGFFPARSPVITMFIIIDEPSKAYYGGDVAAPLFKAIAEKILVYFNIFPELDDNLNEIRL